MWQSIRGYEGLYEINENAVVRRMDGADSDGRKVSAHVAVASRSQNGMRYIALWKDGKRRTYMLHKIYAAAFHISEKDAARRLYRGFSGDRQTVRNVKENLPEDLTFYKEEKGICRVCAKRVYGRYFTMEEKSAGRGASNTRVLSSKGCFKVSFQA